MSMNDQDLIQAIKQVVSDESRLLEEKLDVKLDVKLDAKIGGLHSEILTKLEEQTEELRTGMTVSFDAVQEELDDHNHRIIKLETKPA